MIKILHILSTTSASFGDTSVVMNYYRNIDKTKVAFDIAAMLKFDNSLDEEIKSLGGCVFYFKKPKIRDIFLTIRTLRKIIIDGDYDIVHLHVPVLHSVVKKALKGTNCKHLIIHSHSSKLSTTLLGKIRNYIITRGVSRKCSARFACSRESGKVLFGKHWGSHKTDYILNNAINLDDFNFNIKEHANIRKLLGIDENVMAVCHVGRFSKEKNHKRLIDIFKQINSEYPNSVLFLIGDGPLREEIESYVKYNEMQKQVVFMGTRSDVSTILQGMDVFILPSLFEGLGLSLVEAQSMGLLCFCSDACVEESVISNNLTRIGLNKSNTFWATTIIDKFNFGWDRETYKEITENGFNIKVQAGKLLKIYEGILNVK